MKQYLLSIFIYTIVLLLFTTNVFAIKCYQCTSVNDTRCSNLKRDNLTLDLYKECDASYNGKPPFCRKTLQTILDDVKIVRVHRSCGWEEDKVNTKPCYKYENDFHFEIVCVCSTDGCNAAPQSRTSTALLITAGFTVTALIFSIRGSF